MAFKTVMCTKFELFQIDVILLQRASSLQLFWATFVADDWSVEHVLDRSSGSWL